MNQDTVDLDIPSEISINPWSCGDKDIPSSEIVFFCQVILIYIVIITCIINLSIQNEPHDLWLILLSSTIGLVLPSPTIQHNKRNLS